MWITRFRGLPLPLRALVAASFVNRTGMFVFPLLTVYLVQGKHLGVDEVGLLMSAGSTGLLVGSLLSGPLCELAGRRDTLAASLVLNAVSYLGLATIDGPAWSYGVLLFTALVGMGMFGPAANTLVADLADPADRPFAYTVTYMANNLGMGVGPLLGGVAAAYSYGLMFAGDIVVSLVCALTVLVAVPGGRPVRESGTKGAGGLAGLRAYPVVTLMVLVSFFYVVPLIGLEYTLPLAVTTVLDSSTVLVGAVYTINSVVIVVAGLLVEKRIEKTGTRTLLVTAGLLWAAGMALVLFGFSLAAILLSTVIWTLGEIIVSVVVPTVIAEQVGQRRVSGFMALNGFVLGTTRLVVPAGLGLVWSGHGHQPAFAILLAAPLLGAAAYAFLPIRPTLRRENHGDDVPDHDVPPARSPGPDDLVQRGAGAAGPAAPDAAPGDA